MTFPLGKRYLTFSGYYRNLYGQRLQKLVIDAGMTCPNRDGTVGVGGCTFCDNAAFHPGYSTPDLPIGRQLDEGIAFHKGRYRSVGHYIAYFQSYSNTYAPTPHLRKLYLEALSHPEVVGIAVGTRPDCVDEDKLDLLSSIMKGEERGLEGWRREGFPHPLVSAEYGIESCRDSTLERVNRGHTFECARRAVELTSQRGIPVCGHFIVGLPGESRDTLLEDCRTINSLPLTSVKFHQLQFIRGTAMEREHDNNPGDFMEFTSLDSYLDLMVDILERLRPDLYIERIAGEVPPRFVRESRWGLVRNFDILHALDRKLEERDTYQGRLLE